MPTAVAYVAAYIYEFLAAIGYGGEAGVALSYAAAEVVAYAAAFEVLSVAEKAFAPKGPAGIGQGLEISRADPLAGAKIILGQIKCGGTHVIPLFNEGGNGQYMHAVYALAGHAVDSFGSVYFNQDVVTNANITAITGSANDGKVTSGKWANNHFVRRYDGTQTSVDFILNAAFPTAFDSNFVGRGIAYAAVKLQFDQASNGGTLPQMTFVINGAKVYDPRLDTTNGGSGSQRYTTPSTWTWSQNPALLAAWYLIVDNIIGGGYDPATEIDWATVAAAANICDFNLTGGNTTPNGDQARFTCNILLDATNDFLQNLKAIIDTMLGQFVQSDGKWKIYAAGWSSPAETINYSDFVGPVTIQASTPRTTSGDQDTQRYNAVRVQYVDPAQNWQMIECLPHVNSSYATQDGSETIWKVTQIPGVTDEYQAQRLAELLLRQSRNQVVVSGMLGPKWIGIGMLDVVALNWPAMGWQGKTFRVVNYGIDPSGGVQVALREEQSSDWNDLTTAQYTVRSTSAIPTTNPIYPSAPSSLVTSPAIHGIDVQWVDSVVKPPGTTYQIVESVDSTYANGVTIVVGDFTRHFVARADTATYYYWVDALTKAGSIGGSYPTHANTGIPGHAQLATWVVVASGAVGQVDLYSLPNTQELVVPFTTTRSIDIMSHTFQTSGGPVGIDVFMNYHFIETCPPNTGFIVQLYQGSNALLPYMDLTNQINAFKNGGITEYAGHISFSVVDTPAAGNYTYRVHAVGVAGGVSGSVVLDFTNNFMKFREYKR